MRGARCFPLGFHSALTHCRLLGAFAASWLLLLATPAGAQLESFYTTTGRISISVDGSGSNAGSSVVLYEKPAGATVRKVFLLAASRVGYDLTGPTVSIFGTAVSWDERLLRDPLFSQSCIDSVCEFSLDSCTEDADCDMEFEVGWADITPVAKPIIDGMSCAGPGPCLFSAFVNESSTFDVDGTVLVVVFDDPTHVTSNRAVVLLYGQGASATIDLPSPLDTGSPGSLVDLGLGISFGCQRDVPDASGDTCTDTDIQRVRVDINGVRITSSAGGQDDGQCEGGTGELCPLSNNEGTLMTVGGVSDSNDNPDPLSSHGGNPRFDDELYSLIPPLGTPFVDEGDTAISLTGSSGDDVLFFAYVEATVEVGACFDLPAGFVCRAADGPCDVAEVCDGLSDLCPDDDVAPPGMTCRATELVCDQSEFCDGVSKSCPADEFRPAGTTCRSASGDCDVAEVCTGASAFCPEDGVEPAGTTCRESTGDCDVAEVCNGDSFDCPGDGFALSGTVCRASAGVCDAAEACTGESTSCPANGFVPPGTLCRAPAGLCDVGETCTGESASCPLDGFLPTETPCRPSAGVCDVAEACTGQTAFCPADGFASSGTVCRGAEELCDVEETCTGLSVLCPEDGFEASGTLCRETAGLCDAEERCTGLSGLCPADGVLASGTSCRVAAGDCDQAESCDGESRLCPADVFVPDGTPCDDPLFCNGAETCQLGSCTDGPDPVEPGKVCREAPIKYAATASRKGWGEGIEVPGGEDGLVYLAAQRKGLRIYDASDPANPAQLVSSPYRPPSAECPSEDVFFDEVVVRETTAYIAGGLCGLLMLDVSDPGSVLLLGRFDTPEWVKDVEIRTGDATIAYLADYWGGLRIVDVSDPEAPVELGWLDEDGGLIGPALSVQVAEIEGDVLVYVATMGGFFVVDATVPALPEVVGSYNTIGLRLVDDPDLEDIPQHALVVGDLAYVPIWLGGLLVLDVSNPENPSLMQEVIPTRQAFYKVAAAGSNVYVTEGQCGLRVFGSTEEGLAEVFFGPDPDGDFVPNPIRIAGGDQVCSPVLDPDNDDPFAWDVEELGGFVYVTNGEFVDSGPFRGGFQTIDFRPPLRLLRSGSLPQPRNWWCGLGAELALVLPLLAWCRRRRGLFR